MVQQIFFLLLCAVVFRIAVPRYRRVIRNINFGKAEKISGDEAQRWKNVFLVAFGQKKMFKNLLPAVMHFFIYAAFLLTQIELIEILLDGLTGRHRLFAESLGGFYTFVIGTVEILSVLALVATIIFLVRRNAIKVKRFEKPEMKGWPQLDANLILLGELSLIAAILAMNSADVILQQIAPEYYPATGRLPISGIIGPALLADVPYDWLFLIERFGWWLHLITVFAFIIYLPLSKHLHIVLAFPNVYFGSTQPHGKIENMPDVMAEVQSMLGLVAEAPMVDDTEIPDFGASDVSGLSWKVLLDAYSCTECGRCTAQCPANLTGKALSPRKIVMDIRDRAEDIARKLETGRAQYCKDEHAELTIANFDDGKSLFDYISDEELFACTSCNACVEACPVMINPLRPIIEMRRYRILTEAAGPSEWTPMFTSLENSGTIWQMPAARVDWTKEHA